MKNLFKKYNCPGCNDNSNCTTKEYQFEKKKYINLIISNFNITITDIKENLKLRYCHNCHIYFFENWFNENVTNYLYSRVRHVLGWKNFLNSLNNDQEYFDDQNKIINFIKSNTYKLDSYLEFGCPFMGLLPIISKNLNSKLKTDYSSLQIHKTIMNKRLSEYRFLKNISLYFLIELKILRIYFFLKKFITSFLLRKKNQFFSNNFIPNDIYFIDNSSSINWTSSCNLSGVSCRNLILESMRENLHFTSIINLPNGINFCFLNNVLDHTFEINFLLKILLEKVDSILIKTHLLTQGGPQHLYFLTDNFFKLHAKKSNKSIKFFDSKFKEIVDFSSENNDVYILYKN